MAPALDIGSFLTMGSSMSDQKPVTKVPDGQARFFKTRQMKPTEKGFVGYETEWEPFHKEAEYETPKRP